SRPCARSSVRPSVEGCASSGSHHLTRRLSMSIPFLMRTSSGLVVAATLALGLGCATPAPVHAPAAQTSPANDLLNAVLWMQRWVEYKATTLGAFALARIRLDEALTDANWTAVPKEQTGAYQALPPAVILDIDESIVDNSSYQAWMTLNDTL